MGRVAILYRHADWRSQSGPSTVCQPRQTPAGAGPENGKGRHEQDQQARFAFHDTPPGGKGAEQAYSPFNVFMLAIGLDFVEAGFKQLEVVFLLRHIRHWLIEHFEWIQNNPPAFRQRLHPEGPAGLPDLP